MTIPWKRVAPALAALVAAPSWGAGCAATRPSGEAENQRLEVRVAELRTASRRERQKIRDLENQLRELQERLTGARSGGESIDVPELPVEVVDGAGAVPDVQGGADDDEIVYEGDALRRESLRLDGYRLDPARGSGRQAPPALEPLPEPTDRLPVTSGPVPPIPDTRQARPPRLRQRSYADPRAEYRRYFEALRRRDHATAIAGFRNFLERFPDHDYAVNAQYWLGEAFYDQRRYRAALAEFQKVLDDFPRGSKVPDALLKIGYSHAALGEREAAAAALREVVDRFPRSNPAALAARRLAELGDSP